MLNLEMIKDQTLRLSGDNPGAMVACIEMVKDYPFINPNSPYTLLDLLEEFDIRGVNIWQLYSDKCNKEVYNVAILLCGTKHELLPLDRLLTIVTDSTYSVNLSTVEFDHLETHVINMFGNH